MTEPTKQPEDEDISIDRCTADIGIVCCHEGEIKPLLKSLDRQRKYVDNGVTFRGGFLDETIRVAVAEAGSGFALHRTAAQTLINEHHPAWIMSVGFSSALNDELNFGDVSLANEICDTHGNSLPVKCPIPESGRIRVQKHAVGDSHPRSMEQKAGIAESTGAAVIDTTSLAVAQACAEESGSQHSFLSVRVIIDTASESMPDKAHRTLFDPSAEKETLIGKLTKRFRTDPELVPWDSRANDAAINLNRFLVSVIRRLADKISRKRV